MLTDERARDWPRLLSEVLERPGRVRPHFQPIVDLERAEICGYEALARFAGWPEVGPAEVFAAADAHGLGPELEARAIRAALAARPEHGSERMLAVNVSPRAMVTDVVAAAFAEHARLDGVIIEITEQSDADVIGLAAALSELRSRGALVAVDDAGSGYGSLARITALHPHFVKLDKALVDGVHDDPAKAAVVEMLGDLAARMDAVLVAEGIERLEDLHALIRMQVPLGQGFAFGRPGPGLAELDHEMATHIRARWRPAVRELAIAPLVEAVPMLPEPASPRALGVLFDRRPGPDFIALVDAEGRPSGLVRRTDHEQGHGPVRSLMLVTPDMPVSAVGRRAMARPASRRFDPLICWDETGRYAGLVRIERLIDALAAVA